MRNKNAKRLRKRAYQLAAEWLKKFLNEEEAEKVNEKKVREFEENQEKYIWGPNGRQVSAYSSRFFYKKLKGAFKKQETPNFMISLEDLGV